MIIGGLNLLMKPARYAWGSSAVTAFFLLWTSSIKANDEIDVGLLQSRLDIQAAELRVLRERLDRQDEVFGPVGSSGFEDNCDLGPDKNRIPVVVEAGSEASCSGMSPAPKFHHLNFYADYDGGFMIRPVDAKRHPFQMKIKGWIQFRHHAFSRDEPSWTDNAGVTRPITNRNAFDIERARLTFAGYALDKRLTYFLQLDGDTDGNHTVDFFDYVWAWKFSDYFQLAFGKRKVPAGRQWLLGARRTRFVDRPMAIDFFRPDRSVGVFGLGKIGDRVHYECMVGNGYQVANVPNSASDDRFTFAATSYIDPLATYGNQLADYEDSKDPKARFGHSFVYSPNSSQSAAFAAPPSRETSFLRLGDGTQLTTSGALAPLTTVTDFDLWLYCVDAALKWRGWSINAELLLRWIADLRGTRTLPTNEIFQQGYYVEAGVFLLPKRLDINARYSEVADSFGKGSEVAVGMNWYPVDSPNLKLSFDVTSLDGSPLDNTPIDILVGDDGLLFRTQFQTEF